MVNERSILCVCTRLWFCMWGQATLFQPISNRLRSCLCTGHANIITLKGMWTDCSVSALYVWGGRTCRWLIQQRKMKRSGWDGDRWSAVATPDRSVWVGYHCSLCSLLDLDCTFPDCCFIFVHFTKVYLIEIESLFFSLLMPWRYLNLLHNTFMHPQLSILD